MTSLLHDFPHSKHPSLTKLGFRLVFRLGDKTVELIPAVFVI